MKKLTALLILLISLIPATPTLAAEEKEFVISFTQDTYAEESFPFTAPFNNRNLYLGYDYFYSKGRTRMYIQYSTQQITDLGILPTDVLSANINLYQYERASSVPYIVKSGKVLTPWEQSTLTWLQQPLYLETSKEITINSIIGWASIDIKNILLEQLTSPNYGIVIKSKDEQKPGGIFWSKECLVAPDLPRCNESQLPKITVRYLTNDPPTKPEIITPTNNLITNIDAHTFAWTESTDPQNEKVTYQFQLATSEDFSSTIHKSPWLEALEYKHIINDGEYYWRVVAKDIHREDIGSTTSDVYKIEIDTIAPTPPKLASLPTYTLGSEIKIEWENDETEKHTLTNFLQYSTDIEFTENKYAEIQTTQAYATVAGLTEEKYYYRAKSRDLAGNTSEWSNIVDSSQDLNSPRLSNFNISETYISPFNSLGVKDVTNINFAITDISFLEWTVSTLTSNRELLTKQSGSEQNVAFDWRPNSQFEDTVFIYLEATDNFGQKMLAQPLRLVIDNISPTQPQILTPTANKLTNQRSIYVQFTKEKETFNQITSGFEKKDLGDQNSTSLNLQTEGLNLITVHSTDKAGNFNSSSVNVTTDWSPPLKPELKLTGDTDKRKIYAQVFSDNYSKTRIYNMADLHHEYMRETNPVEIVRNWTHDYEYSFFAIVEDLAGNKSLQSEISTYKTPPNISLGTGGFQEEDIPFPTTMKKHNCIYDYNKTTKETIKKNCNFQNPQLVAINHITMQKRIFWIDLYGSLNRKVDLTINFVKCKDKTFWDPRTWFSCVEQYISTQKKTLETTGEIIGKTPETLKADKTTFMTDNNFKFQNSGWNNLTGKRVSLYSEILFSHKVDNDRWLDFNSKSPLSNELKIPEPKVLDENNERYFRFPFNKIIGVTQWHGYTAFQYPHTGIDFGSYREPVYATADGYIRFAGWDSYFGPCLSGGNTIRIEHDNGKNSVYLHLENYNKSQGQPWKLNERIRKGDLIGLSGNTGSFNCQGLGHHLHYEMRNDRWQSSHVNPVPETEMDWERILTIDAHRYPGRLTGDNPHPGK